MDFRGIFDHGVVRPTEPVGLPDGTEVECHPLGVQSDPTAGDRFWRSRSIEEVAREQSHKGQVTMADLRGDWPLAERIDDFLEAVNKGRR